MSLLAGEGGGGESGVGGGGESGVGGGGEGGESGVEFSGSESELLPNICCVENLGPISLVAVSVSESDSCSDIESC
jgi:hypothetical protein